MVVVGGGEASGIWCDLSLSLMSVSLHPVAVDSPDDLLPGLGSDDLDSGHACGCRILIMSLLVRRAKPLFLFSETCGGGVTASLRS